MDFLELRDKTILICGLANRKSVAWHVGSVLIEAGARVERAIVDKAVRIGRKARIGKVTKGQIVEGLGITTIGKNAEIPDGVSIPRGAVIHTDVTADQFKTRKTKTAAASS